MNPHRDLSRRLDDLLTLASDLRTLTPLALADLDERDAVHVLRCVHAALDELALAAEIVGSAADPGRLAEAASSGDGGAMVLAP